MTTTVRELYKKLGDYSADAVVTITAAADGQEFAIADIRLENNTVNIVIGEKVESEEEEEAA